MGVLIKKQVVEPVAHQTAKAEDVVMAMHWKDLHNLIVEKGKLIQQESDIRTAIALRACPYSVGQKVRTTKGLGVSGLEVNCVIYPTEQTFKNQWRISTFAFTKAGEVSNRVVGIDEEDAPDLGLKLA